MPPAPANPFDQACRHLLREGGEELLAWLLRVAPGDMRFVRWLDTRLTMPGQPERYCDTIAHVTRTDQGGLPWACPIEFQAAPDELMFARLMIYEATTWQLNKPADLPGDRFQLQSVVVNLTGVGRCARRMLWNPGAETTLAPIEWNLQTLDAARILEQVAAGEAPRVLLAWVSLMKNGGEEATIQRWLEVAEREGDPRRKGDFAMVLVFSDLTDHREVWDKALEGFNVIESVTVNKWKAEAAAKSKVEDILGILEDRFGPVPADAKAKIEQAKELAVLQGWVVLAARAESLDDFRQKARV